MSNYISSLSIIIADLGAIFLKERDYLWHKILATSLAVLGLSLILIANL